MMTAKELGFVMSIRVFAPSLPFVRYLKIVIQSGPAWTVAALQAAVPMRTAATIKFVSRAAVILVCESIVETAYPTIQTTRPNPFPGTILMPHGSGCVMVTK